MAASSETSTTQPTLHPVETLVQDLRTKAFQAAGGIPREPGAHSGRVGGVDVLHVVPSDGESGPNTTITAGGSTIRVTPAESASPEKSGVQQYEVSTRAGWLARMIGIEAFEGIGQSSPSGPAEFGGHITVSDWSILRSGRPPVLSGMAARRALRGARKEIGSARAKQPQQ